jgi:hypothetical protein
VLLIRLLTFRPGSPGEVTDQFLRQVLLPGLGSWPGLQHAYMGRVDSQTGLRAALTIWDSDDQRLTDVLPVERAEPIVDPVVETAPASVVLDFGRPEEAVILRIFRGRAKADESAVYLQAVHDGTLADVAAGRGPVALFLGMLDSERFMTASAWPDWRRIEEATGGNIRQPIATRHSDLLIEGTAEHFEIVPNSHLAAADADAGLRLSPDGASSS